MTGLAILAVLVALKRWLDPYNDAFRTREREGWHFWRAPVVCLRLAPTASGGAE